MNKFNFNFDKRIFTDYYYADYFKKTKEILNKFKPNQVVTMQWFQRKQNTVLCGIEFIIQLFKQLNIKDLKIEALSDGQLTKPLEPVLKITGKYSDFAHYEGLIDGILSRASTIATNSYNINKAAGNKAVLNMNDRMDYYLNQQLDGYASYVGGIKNLVTPASFEFLDVEPNLNGTMPHALIASFDGDLIEAAKAYKACFPNNNLVVLVDYNNDVINDSLKVANYFKEQLYAIRIDTSKSLIDKSLQHLDPNKEDIYGVNPTLVKLLREKLNKNGHKHVKIIVSSGFDEQKIKEFEKLNTPVDIYGVGEAITTNRIGFTGDIVLIDNKRQSKVGRENIESKRLKLINYL